MTRRARFVGAVVHLHLVADDGETLEPIPLDPLTVPAPAWPPDVAGIVAELDRRLDAEADGHRAAAEDDQDPAVPWTSGQDAPV